MIAPLRDFDPQQAARHAALRQARRLAATLLQDQPSKPEPVRAIAAWKGWLLLGWMLLVTLCFGLAMLGRLP